MTVKINADTSDGLKFVSDTSGTVDIQSAGTTKMTVGTTIDIQGNELVLDADADTSIHASTDDQIDFKTGGTDRMIINSSGNVIMQQATSPATATLTVQTLTGTAIGIIAQSSSNTGTSDTFANYNASGSYVGGINCTSSATAFPTSSDYRLKENVSYSFDATTRLKQLKPIQELEARITALES